MNRGSATQMMAYLEAVDVGRGSHHKHKGSKKLTGLKDVRRFTNQRYALVTDEIFALGILTDNREQVGVGSSLRFLIVKSCENEGKRKGNLRRARGRQDCAFILVSIRARDDTQKEGLHNSCQNSLAAIASVLVSDFINQGKVVIQTHTSSYVKSSIAAEVLRTMKEVGIDTGVFKSHSQSSAPQHRRLST